MYPSIPLSSFSLAFLNFDFISSYDVFFSKITVKSTTETLAVGIRNAIPVSLPFSSGITLPTAIAAPVEEGIILFNDDLPNLKFFAGPSTVIWVAVAA